MRIFGQIILLTTLFSFPGLLMAQVKDVHGKIVTEIIYNNDNVETIPIIMGRNLLFTKGVMINGKVVGVFAIDTGLNISMIDFEIAKELKLSQNIPGLTTDVNDKRRFNFYKADTINLGRLKINNHILFGGDLKTRYYKFRQPVVGIIGSDILSKSTFTIDYKNFTITFYPREKFVPNGSPIPMKVKNRLDNLGIYSDANPYAGTPVVLGKLNKVLDAELMIDTGEEDGIILRSDTALAYQSLKGNYKVPRFFLKRGDSQNQYSAKITSVETMGIKFEEPVNHFILFPDIPQIKHNNQIGNALLRHLQITFDYENEKIWVKKNTEPPKYREEFDFAEHNDIARAVFWGDLTQAKELLKDKNKRTFLGYRQETLLLLAIESGNAELIELLLSMSVHDLNMPNAAGVTPLMRAAATNQLLSINNLIQRGAQVDAADRDGMTPLFYAIMGDSLAATTVLMNAKAGVNVKMNNGLRPISMAAGQGNLQIFSTLLEAGADIRYVDETGRNLLHVAAFGDNVPILNEIIKHPNHPDLEASDKTGATPLMIAIQFLKFNSVKCLLLNGASVKTMNTKNFKSALDYAYATKNSEMVQLIEQSWEKSK